MAQILCTVLVMFLALFGFIQLLIFLCSRWLSSSQKGILLFPLCGHREDIEFVIRGAKLQQSRRGGLTVVLVDTGLDEESRQMAETLCKRMGDVALMDYDDFEKILQVGLL